MGTEIMAASLESSMAAHEQDALLRDEPGRENNGEEPAELRDTNDPDSKRVLFVSNSVLRVIKTTMGCSYSNLLLPFVFLGLIAGSQGWGDSISFVFNFLAILPLAALLSFATEELAKSVGHTIGGLINATFGNAVEMIVSVWTFDPLLKCEIDVSHCTGGNHCGPARRNQHCAVKYGGQYPFRKSSGRFGFLVHAHCLGCLVYLPDI